MATSPSIPPSTAPEAVKTSTDPVVKLAHLFERLASHFHHHIKNKSAALEPEAAKTVAEAQALVQSPAILETAKASQPEAPPAPDTPAKE